MDDWLGGARSDPRGLLIPGCPQGEAIDLLLTPDGAELHYQASRVALPWNRLQSGWNVTANRPGTRSHQPYGSAVAVGGDLRPGASAMHSVLPRHSLRGVSNLRALRRLRDADTMPLDVATQATRRDRACRDTVHALAWVLATNPAVRGRLADGGRTARLAIDLANGAVEKAWTEIYGFRRQTIEIETAMRALRFEHRYGRPIPGDRLPTADDAVHQILHAISLNQHAVGVDIDHERVRNLVGRCYLDVQPWPFQALTS